MSFHIIIPARYASSRFPGKVLASIGNQSMLEHVWRRAIMTEAKSVTIAVDDERVLKVAESFGAQVIMTGSDHPTGTDRLFEAVQRLAFDINDVVVNVQADEPVIPVENVHQVAANCSLPGIDVATLCEPILDPEEFESPNVVKVVVDKNNRALYFSRAAIPHKGPGLRHIGLYAYRAGFLLNLHTLYASPLEKSENLEQLRWLYNGAVIQVEKAKLSTPIGVDTEADLIKVSAFINS